MTDGLIDRNRWEAWLKEHGNRYESGMVQIGPHQVRQGWVFSNGAFVSDDGYTWLTPSDNPFHRAIMVRQYHLIRQRHAETAFHKQKMRCYTDADYNKLEELHKRVYELREEVRLCDTIIANSPEAKAKTERQRSVDETRREIMRQQEQIMAKAQKLEI